MALLLVEPADNHAGHEHRTLRDSPMGHPSPQAIFKRQRTIILRHEHNAALERAIALSRLIVNGQVVTACAGAVPERLLWQRGACRTAQRRRSCCANEEESEPAAYC